MYDQTILIKLYIVEKQLYLYKRYSCIIVYHFDNPPDTAIAINNAMFEQNGQSGYVLKPAVTWDKSHVIYNHFNPLEKEFDGLHTTALTLHVRETIYFIYFHPRKSCAPLNIFLLSERDQNATGYYVYICTCLTFENT